MVLHGRHQMISESCRQQYWSRFIMTTTLLMTAPKISVGVWTRHQGQKVANGFKNCGVGQAVPSAVSQCLSYTCLGKCSFMEPKRTFPHMSWQQVSSWTCGIFGVVSETFTRYGLPLMLCCAMLAVLCCAALRCAVLCCAVLCCESLDN